MTALLELSWFGMAVLAVALAACLAYVWGRLRREFVVFEYQRGLLFRFGQLAGVLEGGRHVRWGRGYTVHLIDVRPTTASVGGQEVLTADGLAVRLSASARYAVSDAPRAVLGTQEFLADAYQAVHLALRDAVTSLTADELLAQRAGIGERVTEVCRPQFERLGLTLERVELRDITFPGELRHAMARVALAQKEGQAALERARGESAALRSLANAARLLEGNPALMQLRILQSLGDAKGATIVLNASDSTLLPVVRAEDSRQPGA